MFPLKSCVTVRSVSIGAHALLIIIASHTYTTQGRNQKIKIGEADFRGRSRILLRAVEVVEVTTQCGSISPSRGSGGMPPRKFLKIRCFEFESGGNFSHTMVIIIAKNVHWKINIMKINTIIMYNS